MQESRRNSRGDAYVRRPPNREVRIARSRTGLGVYAQRRYQAEEIIGEIQGEVIDDASYSSNYCMDMGGARCLEPAAPFRFVNHSCEPNCYFDSYEVVSATESKPRRRIFLMAWDPIAPGEQLTIDYRWPANMAIPCLCGAKTCRGWIVDPEQLGEVLEREKARIDVAAPSKPTAAVEG